MKNETEKAENREIKTMSQSITVEQRKTAVQSKWDIYYIVVQAINITTPKINDELSEKEVNKLISEDVKVTIKRIS